jgi:hypothetical protein
MWRSEWQLLGGWQLLGRKQDCLYFCLMAYYIRVLGLEDVDIHLDELTAALRAAGLKAAFQLGESCAPHKWSMIAVQAENGPMLSQIERNHVVPGKLAHAELQEFREIIRAHQPLSAVNWLDKYFDRITVVYAFRILDAALLEDNFEIVSTLKTAIWARTGGLLQNDEEGFSNDNGDHILWQFPDEVSGDKYCAVLDGQGNWQRFRMDLSDHFQRMAFWAGEVPQMAVRL